MSSKTQTYVLVGVAAVAVAALAYVLYSGKADVSESPKAAKKSKTAKKRDSPQDASPNAKDDLSPPKPADTSQSAPAAVSPTGASATVEDVDEEDEEEAEKKLRKTYDHTLKRAKQFLQGEKYANAAALFSEAIELASRIPSAGKDILALYNNRSAMYEKGGDFENSLKDIMVVLAMDGKHVKARTRRARIYEKQGNDSDALNDLVFCSIVEGASGIPQSNGPKVAELCKKVSVAEVAEIVERIRNSPSRNLPNKGYCRNFFEAFMSYHDWKRAYAEVDREELVRRSYHELATAAPADGAKAELKDIIDLIKIDLVAQEFNKAFAHMERANILLSSAHLADDKSSEVILAKAFLNDMSGIEMHLRCNLSAAITQYIAALQAISYGNLPDLLTAFGAGDLKSDEPSPEEHQVLAIETVLRLSSAFIELGDKTKAEELYSSVLAATDGTDSEKLRALHPWVLIHRVTLHITRDEFGNFSPTGVEDAVVDLEAALNFTEDSVKTSKTALQCRVMALLKLVHVISQTKVQMGQQPTDVELDKVSSYIQEAKRLSPMNESVIMLDADLLSINGETDAALARCDEVILLSEKSDSIPYVIKANVMMQKALMEMQMAQMQQSQQLLANAQNTMRQVENIFNDAIAIEPNGLEAFAQYAQLKSMLGELDTSLEYLEKALANSRSKDEVQELCVMKAQTLAQQAAIEEYKSQA